ncbi:hypothetical protein FYK55_01870 [Roseiconus nitratireducens]|uniref:Cytochrome c n=1 Tax=Roseiconus nitratireducens TaxID=2605748 RepID=A0A5M6DHZ7_9BACT|nr:hypothetical protein [Roseiconus nitratireducens]KAA5547178.1 hypothetical protein FYK55_01870 [Roseiconus nitratireducens]
MRPKKMKVALVVVFVSVSLVSFKMLAADPPVSPIEHAEGVLMRSKLKRSQRVLEGLVRADFAAIAQGAHEMKLISEAAEWPRARDAVYEHFSAEFRRHCNQLEQLAQEGNHQGATFTYLHMTSLCVECHNYVRDSLRVATPGGDGDIRLIPSEWPEGGKPSVDAAPVTRRP